jgi:glycosyltransferase involved in cell wall biosynthesis
MNSTASVQAPAEQPLVTTIIPTRNRAAFLRDAIESVLSQEVPGRHEIIVVDDSSTDETQQIIAQYNVISVKVKSGRPSITRNAGLRRATGKYIAFLDDDDVWLPNRLKPAIEMLEANPQLGMVYAPYQPADIHLNPFGAPHPPAPMYEGQPVVEFIQTACAMNCVLVRKSVLDDVGYFDERQYGSEDMDITVRIVRKYPCATLKEPVCMVRFHSARPLNPNTSQRLWARFQGSLRATYRHLWVQDGFQAGLLRRERILLELRGFHVPMFLELSERFATVGERSHSRQALWFALKASPLHAMKSPRFWRAAYSTALDSAGLGSPHTDTVKVSSI